eukprot:TRINITY_DN5587_c0_g1_i1.p1 TRINITY_DN5587_c0_g1~~TRINITY_DN5587_c0_g1_i1.p1  ORF type:complete len:467 (+),score=59.82 TRINITY_DN5587_c0_g1_i1:168-1403(+)
MQHAPNDKGVGLMATRFGGQQESDMLERLGEKYQKQGPADELTSHVQLVSLGSYCGPKLSFQKMGRGAETLPFDWMRTRLDGLLHFLRHDFEGFFDFVTQQRVPDSGVMVMFRGYYHSFWHDDPTEPSMREKYHRRIARLWSINSSTRPVLFVRSMVGPEEVLQMPELMAELSRCFGRDAKMLLILENQTRLQGPILIQNQPNLMLYYLELDVHGAAHPDNPAPYARPTQCALDWCVGRIPQNLRQYPNVETAFQIADPYAAGLKGLGGLDAFEQAPPTFVSQPALHNHHAGGAQVPDGQSMPCFSLEPEMNPRRATECWAFLARPNPARPGQTRPHQAGIGNMFPISLVEDPFAFISHGSPLQDSADSFASLRPCGAARPNLCSPPFGLLSAADMAAAAANFAPLPDAPR